MMASHAPHRVGGQHSRTATKLQSTRGVRVARARSTVSGPAAGAARRRPSRADSARRIDSSPSFYAAPCAARSPRGESARARQRAVTRLQSRPPRSRSERASVTACVGEELQPTVLHPAPVACCTSLHETMAGGTVVASQRADLATSARARVACSARGQRFVTESRRGRPSALAGALRRCHRDRRVTTGAARCRARPPAAAPRAARRRRARRT